jgi:hypothetical protein
MKEILTSLRSKIIAGLPEIKGVHILADADILPTAVRFPCVGLKDGETSFSEGMAETETIKGSISIYIYVQILKEEGSVMGEGDKKGVLEHVIDLRHLLNFDNLDGLVQFAYCPDLLASETMFAGENVFIQRKGIRYIYEIAPEARLPEVQAPEEVTETITIIAPNGGEEWTKGTTQEIAWEHTGSIDLVKIELVQDGAVVAIISASTDCDGSFDWEISEELDDGEYRVRITAL